MKQVNLLFTLLVCSFTHAQNPKIAVQPANPVQKSDLLVDPVSGLFTLDCRNRQMEGKDLMDSLATWFGLDADHQLIAVREYSDELSQTHSNYQLRYKGYNVEGGLVMVHSKNENVYYVNGLMNAVRTSVSEIAVTPESAALAAQQFFSVPDFDSLAVLEKILFPQWYQGKSSYSFAYKLLLRNNQPMVNCHLFVDAQTGAVVGKHDLFASGDTPGTANTFYSGTQPVTCQDYNGGFRLKSDIHHLHTMDGANTNWNFNYQEGILEGAQEYLSSTSSWTANPANPALDAHWGSEKTMEYYQSKFNRNGVDGHGFPLTQYLGSPVYSATNAYAMFDPGFLVFGMGDGGQYHPLTSLDIVAHEYTHLVTLMNGNGGLAYGHEPGALNESFSDIFGIAVDFEFGTSPDWLIGEEITVSQQPFRSFSNPNSTACPDTYRGDYWINPIAQAFDNGGVHTNSSIQNFWFYLLVNGGAGTNDHDYDYSVTSIGMDKAVAIAYRNLMTYLTPGSGFFSAYHGSVQAAIDLFGENSAEHIAVAEAWRAVGVPFFEGKGCNGVYYVYGEATGIISDGSANEDYQANTGCRFIISSFGASYIELKFNTFDTEYGIDIVNVYSHDITSFNGPVLLLSHSGNSLPPVIRTPPLPYIEGQTVAVQMYIEFTTNNTGQRQGWEAAYKAVFDNITFFPNPASTEVTVLSNNGQNLQTVVLYDLSGRVVANYSDIPSSQLNLSVDHLMQGRYLLEIRTADQTLVELLEVR